MRSLFCSPTVLWHVCCVHIWTFGLGTIFAAWAHHGPLRAAERILWVPGLDFINIGVFCCVFNFFFGRFSGLHLVVLELEKQAFGVRRCVQKPTSQTLGLFRFSKIHFRCYFLAGFGTTFMTFVAWETGLTFIDFHGNPVGADPNYPLG